MFSTAMIISSWPAIPVKAAAPVSTSFEAAAGDAQELALEPVFTPGPPQLVSPPRISPGQTAPPLRPTADIGSDIVVTAHRGPAATDPLKPINEASFKANQAFDRTITRPAAIAYERHIPSPIRSGLRNFFLNLHEVDVFLNFLIQLKPGKAAETAGRFAINTTAGAAGLFDIAKRKPFHLPRRSNGLADTLGYYGVGAGPFFFLPLIGPTTLRDAVGNALDGMVLPTLVGKPFTGASYTVPSAVVRALDHRAEADDQLTEIQASPSPYLAARRDYLTRRQREIEHLRGRNYWHNPPPPPSF